MIEASSLVYVPSGRFDLPGFAALDNTSFPDFTEKLVTTFRIAESTEVESCAHAPLAATIETIAARGIDLIRFQFEVRSIRRGM